MQTWTNNPISTLAAGITTTSTSLTVQAGDGALFPSPVDPNFHLVTLVRGSVREIIKSTGRAGDVLQFSTGNRGQEGTAASTFNAGDAVEGRITRDTLVELQRSWLYSQVFS